VAEENGELMRLRDLVRVFVDERDWDQFHTPKNLSSALSVEAAEQVRHEMADVLVYLVRLADKLDVDLMAAVEEKMVLNRAKYPAELVRGDARKYDEYKQKPQK
jgi:NTP pyrophosphatase (non-canonical NTP hydrolase)